MKFVKLLMTFIVLLVIISLGFPIGWVCWNGGDVGTNMWGMLFLPWIGFVFYWSWILKRQLEEGNDYIG
jgi:hypothetical protein